MENETKMAEIPVADSEKLNFYQAVIKNTKEEILLLHPGIPANQVRSIVILVGTEILGLLVSAEENKAKK